MMDQHKNALLLNSSTKYAKQNAHLQSAVTDHEAVERVGVNVRAVAGLIPRVEIVRSPNDWLSSVARGQLETWGGRNCGK